MEDSLSSRLHSPQILIEPAWPGSARYSGGRGSGSLLHRVNAKYQNLSLTTILALLIGALAFGILTGLLGYYCLGLRLCCAVQKRHDESLVGSYCVEEGDYRNYNKKVKSWNSKAAAVTLENEHCEEETPAKVAIFVENPQPLPQSSIERQIAEKTDATFPENSSPETQRNFRLSAYLPDETTMEIVKKLNSKEESIPSTLLPPSAATVPLVELHAKPVVERSEKAISFEATRPSLSSIVQPKIYQRNTAHNPPEGPQSSPPPLGRPSRLPSTLNNQTTTQQRSVSLAPSRSPPAQRSSIPSYARPLAPRSPSTNRSMMTTKNFDASPSSRIPTSPRVVRVTPTAAPRATSSQPDYTRTREGTSTLPKVAQFQVQTATLEKRKNGKFEYVNKPNWK